MFNVQNVTDYIKACDPEVGAAVEKELQRERRNLELIASENIVSPAVMAAVGSVLTNKYAEGYPGRRYYGGCVCVDECETIAIERAKKLFGAEYANVQPHSGSQANFAAYFAVLQPGDTVLGMSLAEGGHLTHGSPVNMSGKLYNFVRDRHFGIDKGIEAINDLPLLDLHCTDLGDSAIENRKTRGFNIKNNNFIIKACTNVPAGRTRRVVDKIGFHSVDDLNISDLLGCQHRIGKALKISVVGNGYGRMPPRLRRLHGIIGRDQAVHRRHIGM